MSEGVILRYRVHEVVREHFVGFDSETIPIGFAESLPFIGPFQPVLGDDGVKDLLDALVQGKFTRVKTVILVFNNLSDVSVERIAQALKTNSTVTHVELVSGLPIHLLLLQSSCALTLQYVTRAVCTEPQLGYH
jgi:hypothetical protein